MSEYEEGVARGQRVVADPDRFPTPQPDYTMKTAQGHPPIPPVAIPQRVRRVPRDEVLDEVIEHVRTVARGYQARKLGNMTWAEVIVEIKSMKARTETESSQETT